MRLALERLLNMQSSFPEHHSVRVVLLNERNELLLMKAEDPRTTEIDGTYNGPFWFLIGGQIEEGESVEDTAFREICEETGLEKEQIKLGPVVWYGDFNLVLSGQKRTMKQKFIVARTACSDVSLDSLTSEEQKVVKKLEWFSLERLRKTQEIVYPVGLEDFLRPLIDGVYPKNPMKIQLDKKPEKHK